MPAEQPPAFRCRQCAYVIEGLPSPGTCPECAAPFDFTNPRTFTLRPPFLRWKFWLPAWLLAVGGGAVAFAITIFGTGSMGAAAWVGVPLSAGAVLGYATRTKWFWLVILALTVGLSLIISLFMLNIAGVFCGMALAVIFAGPLMAGTAFGLALRAALKSTRFSQRSYLPALVLLLGPLWGLAEGPRSYPRERVTTTRVIAAPVNAAWDSLVFYEEVRHEPPLILRVGLARPLYTLGQSAAIGDTRTCVYNKGHITKQVTALAPGRLLAFDVVEQQIGYERDVTLTGGSFTFAPVDATHTRIELTTDYVPHLGPRFAWRPFEAYAVHTLHGHVIEGIEHAALEHQTDSSQTPEGPDARPR